MKMPPSPQRSTLRRWTCTTDTTTSNPVCAKKVLLNKAIWRKLHDYVYSVYAAEIQLQLSMDTTTSRPVIFFFSLLKSRVLKRGIIFILIKLMC